MDNRAATGWGELQKQEQQERDLEIPYWMTKNYKDRVEAVARKIKRQQHEAERYRRKQRIKGRLITAAWTVLIVGFAAAAIVVH